jgi:F0F1-type ATP synthase membrane subunit c/vacuolar-type H+-ATPase subunit K
MLLAHCTGLLALTVVGAIMQSAPNLNHVRAIFFVGVVFSSVVFLPVLVVSLVFVRRIIEHRIAFLVLGPILLATLSYLASDLVSAKVVGLSACLSSLVLFPFLRSMACNLEDTAKRPSTA